MSGPLLLPTWDELSGRPEIVATMRRYLTQIGCVLRPGSVNNADQALRAFEAATGLTLDVRMPADTLGMMQSPGATGMFSVPAALADAAPVGDSALATALQRLHQLPERPDAEQTARLMSRFAPHRSLATMHLWTYLKEAA